MPILKRAQSPSSRKHRKNSLQVLSSKIVYDGKVFQVTSDEVKEPSGITARRDIVRHSGSVVVLAVDDSGSEPRVLLERQYRYAARDCLWELPAGRIDPGEQPLAAARRELREETGYRARQWKRALFFYSSPGFLDETMTIYLARGLSAGEAQPEADEAITCALLPFSQAVTMVLSGRIRDGKTIAGVLWLAQSKLKVR
ncbi:MAG TPA: NUDIX hydrolase [Terriglobales bacterium]|nr:NUDIX hydrolase [Terriglobales bacterium]